MTDFFTLDGMPWPRRLWDIGSLLALEELWEAGGWVTQPDWPPPSQRSRSRCGGFTARATAMGELPEFAKMTKEQIGDWFLNNDTGALIERAERPTEPMVRVDARGEVAIDG